MKTFENPTCPECGTDNALPIIHGKPSSSLIEAADRGEVFLAGCMRTRNAPAPNHRCRNPKCNNEF